MASAFTVVVSSLTWSEAAQYLAGSPDALVEVLVDEDIQKLLRCALVVALVTSAVVSAVDSEVAAEASVEEIGAASGEASTVVLVAVASAVVIVASVVPPMVLVALPTRLADLAPQADMVVDLTAIVTTTEEVGVTDAAMMTEAVAATAVAASIDPAREATWSHWVPDRVTAAIAAVGIAIEATTTAEEVMTIAETTASVRTKAAQATKESESCVDTNDGRTTGLVVGIFESTSFAFLVFIFSLFDTKGKQTEAKPFSHHLEAIYDQGKSRKWTWIPTYQPNRKYIPRFLKVLPIRTCLGMTIPGHT